MPDATDARLRSPEVARRLGTGPASGAIMDSNWSSNAARTTGELRVWSHCASPAPSPAPRCARV